MRPSRTVFEIHRVIPVQVCAIGDTIRVSRPQGSRIVVCWQTECISMFSNAVYVWTVRQARFDTQILRLKDQRV